MWGIRYTAASPRHCERSEAIHLAAQRKNGLLRCARNDGWIEFCISRDTLSPRFAGTLSLKAVRKMGGAKRYPSRPRVNDGFRCALPILRRYDFAFSRRTAPEACSYSPPQKTEGAGNAGCTLHPRSRVQCMHRNAHTSIQVQPKHSGIPCAMALRHMPRSPWRRIRRASIAAGLMAKSIRLDRIRHRKLDTSHGCQDHTVLPYASASYVLRDVNRSVQPNEAQTQLAEIEPPAKRCKIVFR